MKFHTVQYLRAVAALVVVVTHALLHPITYVNIPIRRFGSFGVVLFFVISGFIIVYTTGKGGFKPGNFIRRRLERVVPLYWIVTAGVAVLALAAPSLLKNTTFTWTQFIGSLLFIPHARPDGAVVPMMMLGWTLNYEMFFYLVFAAMAPLTAGRRILAVTAIFFALIALGLVMQFTAPIPWFYTQPLLITFCIGMGVGYLLLRYPDQLFVPRLAPAWLAAAILFLAIAFAVPSSVPPGPLTDLPFAAAGGALIMFGLSVEVRLPKWRFGVLLGDASYSMYLTHMYIVAASILVVQKLTGSAIPWLDVMLSVTLSIAVSIPIWRLVDRPIYKTLRRLDRSAQQRQAPA